MPYCYDLIRTWGIMKDGLKIIMAILILWNICKYLYISNILISKATNMNTLMNRSLSLINMYLLKLTVQLLLHLVQNIHFILCLLSLPGFLIPTIDNNLFADLPTVVHKFCPPLYYSVSSFTPYSTYYFGIT